jgi:hypothetical protein
MGSFDGTARRLAIGPTLLFPADPVDAMADAVLRYDPAVHVRSDRFVFGNGVLLHGPIEVTADLARRAGLPSGMAAAYYGGSGVQGRERRPDDAKLQDAERLVRGLWARLGGMIHGERPPADLTLRASVYSARELPVEEVIGVLQPFADGKLSIDDDTEVADAYFLITEEDSLFFTMYWPPRLARSKLQPPPPATGELHDKNPCRWDLRTKLPAQSAGSQTCLRVGEAALVLARAAGGVVIDVYGFPVSRPEDLLPR